VPRATKTAPPREAGEVERNAVAVLCGAVAVLCGAVAVLCGAVAVLCGRGAVSGRTGRGEALAFTVVASATPIQPGGAERLDMSLSDRESLGASLFSVVATLD
jgi:hypothetical protein